VTRRRNLQPVVTRPNSNSAECVCELCARRKGFTFPRALADEVKAGRAVVFAGSGISTEDRAVFPYTLYEDISGELNQKKAKISFPELIDRYCKEPNGRARFLRKVTDRFGYIDSFPELYRGATSFHREISTIYQFENIITTNWDDYFERECGATPFVYPEDFALWDLPGRKVFKIHGSINNFGSLVASSQDYKECYRRLQTGVVGGALKTLLATRTIIYVGYSFEDTDFKKITEIITKEMKGTKPHSYFVTLDETAPVNFGKDFTVIVTEGTHFIEVLKEHLVAEKAMLPDTVFDALQIILLRVQTLHDQVQEISLRKHPTILLTLCYQDGLIHA